MEQFKTNEEFQEWRNKNHIGYAINKFNYRKFDTPEQMAGDMDIYLRLTEDILKYTDKQVHVVVEEKSTLDGFSKRKASYQLERARRYLKWWFPEDAIYTFLMSNGVGKEWR